MKLLIHGMVTLTVLVLEKKKVFCHARLGAEADVPSHPNNENNEEKTARDGMRKLIGEWNFVYNPTDAPHPTFAPQPAFQRPTLSPVSYGQVPTAAPVPYTLTPPPTAYNNTPKPTPYQTPGTPKPTPYPTKKPPTFKPTPHPTPMPSTAAPSDPSEFPSVKPTPSPSVEPSEEPSVEPSAEPSEMASENPSFSSMPTTTQVPSSAPTTSAAPSGTPTLTSEPSESNEPSEEPTVSDEPSEEPSESFEPSVSLEPSEEPTVSEEPSNAPSESSAPTDSEQPSSPPSVSQSPSSTPTVSIMPTSTPVPTASPTVSAVPTSEPSVSLQPSVSALPSETPSQLPSQVPSTTPSESMFPSDQPSDAPSEGPSVSVAPSDIPSVSVAPSETPSSVPSMEPSVSASPSLLPSTLPSESAAPSSEPSNTPSMLPSVLPSMLPSLPTMSGRVGEPERNSGAPCTVCGEGFEMTKPYAKASMMDGTETQCRVIENEAQSGSFTTTQCQKLAEMVFFPCGCTSIQTPLPTEVDAPTFTPTRAPTENRLEIPVTPTRSPIENRLEIPVSPGGESSTGPEIVRVVLLAHSSFEPNEDWGPFSGWNLETRLSQNERTSNGNGVGSVELTNKGNLTNAPYLTVDIFDVQDYSFLRVDFEYLPNGSISNGDGILLDYRINGGDWAPPVKSWIYDDNLVEDDLPTPSGYIRPVDRFVTLDDEYKMATGLLEVKPFMGDRITLRLLMTTSQTPFNLFLDDVAVFGVPDSGDGPISIESIFPANMMLPFDVVPRVDGMP